MKLLLLTTICTAALSLTACNPSSLTTSEQASKAIKLDPNTVIKSAQDKRDYAYKKLGNGLKVVVVSDPDADKAAASLDVHIGHMADPADREGLTHYLEHMLFLGTGKYPEVGEYGKFISKHGGSKNAGTGQEHTSYFFSIDNAQLEPALDRFSRFFVDPLFDPEFVQKERNAVESEYSLKVKEDARRYREAVKQTVNQDHPMSQFSVGNLETLSDTEESTILDDVKAHYEKYYSSDIMTLAVIGNYPTDELMAWAEEKFSLVPFDVLKEKGYVKSFYVYASDVVDFTELYVNFNLTDKGYENSEEIGKIADLGFEFQDKYSVSRFAGNLSSRLHDYPANHILDISRVWEDFDPDLIKSYLSAITPEKARVIYASPDITSDTKEARYDVAYSMEKIDADTLSRWANPKAVEGLSLPAANPYIAEDISMKTSAKIDSPKLAYDKPGVRLYYENENEFELPKSSLNFRIYSAKAFESEPHMMAISLHANIINDLISAESYPASQAGLYYGIGSASRAYNIGVQGYNDKIDVFLKQLLKNVEASNIDQATFDRLKKNMVQNIQNEKFARPINQIFGMISVESAGHPISREKRLQAIKGMDFTTFKSLLKDLFETVEIEGTYAGNINQSDVQEIGDILRKAFDGQLKSGVKPSVTSLNLEEGADFVRQVDIDHNDSTILWGIQGDDDSYEERAKFALIRQIIGQRFYKSLRTEQQYGYVVGLTTYAFDETPVALFYIQSPKAHPSELRAKIQEFMEAQTEYLVGLTDEEFEGFREGLLSSINKKFDNVYAKGNTLHSDLIYERYNFDNRAQLTAAVKALSADDIAAFYKEDILSDNRRSMTMWSIGKAHAGDESYNASAYDICKTDKCIYGKSISN